MSVSKTNFIFERIKQKPTLRTVFAYVGFHFHKPNSVSPPVFCGQVTAIYLGFRLL